FPLDPVPRAVSNVSGGGGSASGAPGASRGQNGGGTAKAAGKTQAAPSTGSQPAEQADPVPIAPASSTEPGGGGGGGIPAWLVAIGLVVLGGGAVWGGWVMYRRRLP
ncbi:MAG TPA: hypothetical protein VHU24_00775, partial [Solirubrobacterales bacterium]|nr:hypothetical protein [Solirubrobacterales bacterium]